MMDDIGGVGVERITNGHCPHCNGRGFVLGPQGGAAINIECASLECRSRFNVVMFGGRCLMAQSIPRLSEGGAIWPSNQADPRAPHAGTFS